MAATQAEKQQNDVNSEKVQPDQHINVRNSLLQNGTDKSGVRAGGSVVIPKTKNTGGKNLAIEMSQYRQDGNSGGSTSIPTHNTTVGPVQTGGPCVSDTSETESSASGAPTSESSPFSGEAPPSGDGYGFPYSRDAVHNSGEGLHAFGPRHSFGGPKQPTPNFSQPPQPRFVSGQAISQQTGPTPTLNQLLQSSNPMPHRYQNSYDQPYNQGWSQKPMGPYSGAPSLAPTATPTYRTQGTLPSPYGSAAPTAGYSDAGRTGWPGHSVTSQHPPSSPGPPSSGATPASQPSPQPTAPSHSPGPGSGLPPSPQHQGFPSRPAQPTTPNAHGPDAADLSGGNSNDSSGGPIPGTPNSQGMRPTPSPTGSTGSRSMSPAVGQQNIPMPPRPSSGPSDPPTRISHSPIGSAPGSYPSTHPASHPSHAPHGYKTHPGMTPSAPPTAQQMTIYQTSQQYPQSGGYPPRSQQYPGQGYGPPVSQAPPSNAMSAQQYQGRQPNHMPNSQFQPYQQGWPTPPPSSKGNGPPQAPTSPRPPHYLKHHLQHKMGFGAISGTPPSPGPPQTYHMGPPPPGHHHSGMGPPNNPSMGPPNIPSSGSQPMPNSHSQHDGPMPPPSSTPNSHSIPPDMMDNGITTTAQSGMGAHVSTASSGSVTSVVTTGPDGAPIDEGSQQSTLSNASAASGEDPQCTTPKSGRKNDMGGHYSHPSTPQSTVPSPGAASMNSIHEEYSEISSPNWPRTPASPVFNSHVPPQDTYRSKKTDSLGKLYEMDDSPDRRGWLDKLLAFMDERRTPITTCPTISKNPLDLFRLYVYVKERGGFMEVTKNKTWKDIAGLLGIGASSSAAYTLRKHYTKNLLAYECQFDRGGIDPQPIINQVEASSKKKSAKAASVPSPGSSNSQDSFPAPGSGGGSLDGYGYGYAPGPNQDYNTGQRPSSQANAPSPHGGAGNVNHLNNSGAPGGPSPAGGAGDNVNVSNPFDDVSPSSNPRGGPFAGGQHPPYTAGAPPRQQGQNYSGGQGAAGPGGTPSDQYSPYSSSPGYPPAVRPSPYPPYSGGDSGVPPPSPGSSQTPPASSQDHYNRYGMGNTPSGGYQPRPSYGATPNSGGPPTSQPPAGPYAPQQDYYRPDQPGAPNSTSYQQPKNMPPPGPQPPRRHPDFAKDQQSYSQYGQNRPQMYNWPNNSQFRPSQYSGSGGPQSQQWQGARPSGQWDRYPPPNQPYSQGPPGQQQWNAMAAQVPGQPPPMRTPMGPRSGKPFSPSMIPPKGGQQPQMGASYTPNQVPKREITFPPDSVEATVPVVYRRKKLCKQDLGPVDAWRIMMSLRSGLLAESTYAIDMLNILLYDDTSIQYFGLNQWPSLLDLLLEHFRKGLSDIFDRPFPKPETEVAKEPDMGAVAEPIDPDHKTVLLKETNNYSTISRRGDPIKVEKSDDLFVRDHRKSWDVHGDSHQSDLFKEVETDPWNIHADHLLPTFQAEFGRIPFHMKLKEEGESSCKREEETYSAFRPPTPPPDEGPPAASKSDRKRRTKTLNDVISRIKKDTNSTESAPAIISAEVNNTPSADLIDKVKTEDIECEKTSVDLSVSVNGELKTNETSDNEMVSQVQNRAGSFKRRRSSDVEDEAYTRDEASLILLTESQDNLGKRCVCMSNILRSLTFVPGNEAEFSKNATFLKLAGKLLLLHHSHPPRTQKTRNYDREEDADFGDSCSSLQGEGEWWWDFLQQIRENILVAIANISGQIDVSQFSEEIARPLLDGLLHWAICPSAAGQDPFPSVGPSSLLSPQRLALEALCKLCVTNCNVDLVIATPPFSRLEKLCGVLTKHLCRSEDQVLREFSINLLHYLAAADSSLARVVASQTPCVSLLVAFIEHAEQSALGVANQHGIGALRDNPDSMGTSLDMLRRAAATLVFLAQHPDNRALMVQQEARLLALVMSQILDQQVALLLSKVLFQISRS
ncbi:trithorax group protein osa isoform X3 [Harmonia axyridis]|uniref:trithorax group protein osa isoform X3 n=1 Tax=Harmonia axyridis TaxID=115357 RepID=UPI001E277B1D|nr:trithorax group protein osa isoform X3 [Harmonia axyridis]